MKQFRIPASPNQALSVNALCNEIELQYFPQIKQASGNIVIYLQKNVQIENLLPATSELVHIIFFKLRYEMKQCFLKEKRILFPLVSEAGPGDSKELATAIDPFKKTHQQILELIQKLRQIMCQFETKPGYSKEYNDFNDDLRTLENNIFKWILTEEDLLFPKVYSDLAKAKFISTVFR